MLMKIVADLYLWALLITDTIKNNLAFWTVL